MQFPRPSSNARKVIDVVEKNNSLTLEAGVAIHGILNKSMIQTIALYNNLVTHGWLLFYDNHYYLSSVSIGKLKKERGVVDGGSPSDLHGDIGARLLALM